VPGAYAISRVSRLHLPWIPFPPLPITTFYGVDALLGYITALLEPRRSADLDLAITAVGQPMSTVIGKDICASHAVYWPPCCLSAGLEPPQHVGHGFLTREGQNG